MGVYLIKLNQKGHVSEEYLPVEEAPTTHIFVENAPVFTPAKSNQKEFEKDTMEKKRKKTPGQWSPASSTALLGKMAPPKEPLKTRKLTPLQRDDTISKLSVDSGLHFLRNPYKNRQFSPKFVCKNFW